MPEGYINEDRILNDPEYKSEIIDHLSSGKKGGRVMIEQARDLFRENIHGCKHEYDYVKTRRIYFCDGPLNGIPHTTYHRIQDKNTRDYFYGKKTLGELLPKNPGILWNIADVLLNYNKIDTVNGCILNPNKTDCGLMIERYCEELRERKQKNDLDIVR